VYSFLKHSEKTEEEHLNPSKILWLGFCLNIAGNKVNEPLLYGKASTNQSGAGISVYWPTEATVFLIRSQNSGMESGVQQD
jgi:hypothetical protein